MTKRELHNMKNNTQLEIRYVTVFVFIACALGSITAVWGADNPLPANFDTSPPEPTVFDDDLIIKKFSTGLNYPTSMYFVGDDILVLEKSTGKIIRIKDNGSHYNESVLDVAVYACWESGFLGISSISNHVFLYFTESESGFDKIECHDQPVKNKVYRYDWNGENLINPILIKELPSVSYHHHGGVITTGPNNEVYFVIGSQRVHTAFQNVPGDRSLETSSIFKIDTQNNNNIELFAMGIRNSFGLDIDPDKLPSNISDFKSVESFIKEIIDSTIDFCPVYKPNLAFYERFGSKGFALLENIVDHIGARAITIADGKRGDIGNTCIKYAESIFQSLDKSQCAIVMVHWKEFERINNNSIKVMKRKFIVDCRRALAEKQLNAEYHAIGIGKI